MRTLKVRPVRSLLAAAGAATLIVVLATPASAALPFNEAIDTQITGGLISVGSQTFPLGDDVPPGDPTDCNPTEIPSNITANVGALVAGSATINNFDFNFQPGTRIVDFPIVGEQVVCVTITVSNQASLSGTLTDTGVVTIPGVVVRVDIDNGLLGANCRLDPVNVGTITGNIGIAGPPNTGTLDTASFPVPATTDCNFASQVDTELGVPGTGDATFEIQVNWS